MRRFLVNIDCLILVSLPIDKEIGRYHTKLLVPQPLQSYIIVHIKAN